jgi:hypothetical protein
MKKSLIASIVGGIIIFFWQFLSNAALDLHRPAQQYSPKQDSVLQYLHQQLPEGRYFMPTVPAGTSSEEEQKLMEASDGKPWAIVEIHDSMSMGDMTMNLVRSLITNIIMVYLLVWMLGRANLNSFSSIFLTCVVVGLIGFLYFPYATFIWYKTPGIWSHFNDAWIAWALNGLWLGWYLRRN